jgi:hypothetical protein
MADAWATGHLTLHDQGLNRPGRELDAAAFCRQVAHDDPANARFWLAEATQWEHWSALAAQGIVGTPPTVPLMYAAPAQAPATVEGEDTSWLDAPIEGEAK